MSVRPEGRISTSDMIAELPGYVHQSDKHVTVNASRKDSKFSQLVRNLKSNKTTKSNFICQGYAQDVPGGFQITPKDWILCGSNSRIDRSSGLTSRAFSW